MITRIVAPLFAALAIIACASIDAPASFVPAEAGTDPSFTAPAPCGRVLPRTITSNANARIYGAAGGPQAICATIDLDVPSGGAGEVVFCVAGTLSEATRSTPKDIGLDLDSCAYCLDARTNCDARPDGGAPRTCANSYAPTRGTLRIVRLGENPGDAVWIDVGDLVMLRVERRDGGTIELQPRDCLFADGLTFQGKLEAATCTSADTTECKIATTATQRFP